MADRRLQVFHAVAHCRSFSRAAEVLFMTQPAVSFQVRQFEEQLNTRLFDRSAGRVALTPAGEIVLEYADRILGLNGEMEQRVGELAGQVRGSLRLGVSPSLAATGLPRLLAEFGLQYPSVEPCLVVDADDEIQDQLLSQRLDLAVLGSEVLKPGLTMEVVAREELRVICAAGHPLAASEYLEAAQLAGQRRVVRSAGSTAQALADRCLSEAGVDVEGGSPRLSTGTPGAQVAAVASGWGLAVMPMGCVRGELAAGRLRAIPLQPKLQRGVGIVHLRERFRSRLVSSFIDFLTRRAGDLGL
jgi:DNA-binding transcriptional LysR family regulator